jgi:hypothetical protein
MKSLFRVEGYNKTLDRFLNEDIVSDVQISNSGTSANVASTSTNEWMTKVVHNCIKANGHKVRVGGGRHRVTSAFMATKTGRQGFWTEQRQALLEMNLLPTRYECSFNLPEELNPCHPRITVRQTQMTLIHADREQQLSSTWNQYQDNYTKNSSYEKILDKNLWMIIRRRGITWEHNKT